MEMMAQYHAFMLSPDQLGSMGGDLAHCNGCSIDIRPEELAQASRTGGQRR